VGWWVASRQPTIRFESLGPNPTIRRTLKGSGPTRALYQGVNVADKSPRQTMSKKSGKSLKQKRADKRAKAERSSTTDVLHNQKH
jgi:hypothetical protein